MIVAGPWRLMEILHYRDHAADLLRCVIAEEGRSDHERDALAKVGIAAAGLVELLDDLERARLRD